MTELTRREIQTITGLATSTLTRQLSRFPLARSGRGRFSTADSGFAGWLASFESTDHTGDDLEAAYQPTDRDGTGLARLPSGILLPWEVLDYLRTAPEPVALAYLDRVIAVWQLPPHATVPDRLRRWPLALPSGTRVSARQWSVFRGADERRAIFAFDVLIRSYGVLA